MANYFDSLSSSGEKASEPDNYFSSLTPKPGANKGIVNDTLVGLGKGVMQIPAAVTGLADIPAGIAGFNRPFDRATDAIGNATGFKPSQWAKDADNAYSPEMQQARQNVNQAWDDPNTNAFDVAKAYAKNPRAIAGTVTESVPAMVAGGGLGALSKAAGIVKTSAAAAGLGEGAYQAGQSMDTIDPSVDPRKAALTASAIGGVTGVIGRYSGELANKLGLADAQQLIATGGAAGLGRSTMPLAKKVIGGAIQEGALEEAPQSAIQSLGENYANDKPLTEGMARNVTEGAIAGHVMGGAAQVAAAGPLSRAANKAPALQQPEATANQWQQPDYTVKPDANALIQNRTIPGKPLQESIDSQYQDGGYNPLAGAWEKPTVNDIRKPNEAPASTVSSVSDGQKQTSGQLDSSVNQQNTALDPEALAERQAIQSEDSAPDQPYDNSVPFNPQTQQQVADDWEMYDLLNQPPQTKAKPEQDIEARKRLLQAKPAQQDNDVTTTQPPTGLEPRADTAGVAASAPSSAADNRSAAEHNHDSAVPTGSNAEFSPTHKLNDGYDTPVVKTEDGYQDAEGFSYAPDEDATPIDSTLRGDINKKPTSEIAKINNSEVGRVDANYTSNKIAIRNSLVDADAAGKTILDEYGIKAISTPDKEGTVKLTFPDGLSSAGLASLTRALKVSGNDVIATSKNGVSEIYARPRQDNQLTQAQPKQTTPSEAKAPEEKGVTQEPIAIGDSVKTDAGVVGKVAAISPSEKHGNILSIQTAKGRVNKKADKVTKVSGVHNSGVFTNNEQSEKVYKPDEVTGVTKVTGENTQSHNPDQAISVSGKEAAKQEFVKVKDVYGSRHLVDKREFDSGRTMLSRYNSSGQKIDGMIHRENIDLDGKKAKEHWKDIPYIAGKNDKPFKTEEGVKLKIRSLGQDINDFEIKPANGGFIAVSKRLLKNEKPNEQANQAPTVPLDKQPDKSRNEAETGSGAERSNLPNTKAEEEVKFGKVSTYQGKQNITVTKRHDGVESESSIVRRKGEKTFRIETPNGIELARDIATLKEAKASANKLHGKVQVINGRPFAVSKSGDVVLLKKAYGSMTGGTASQLEDEAKKTINTQPTETKASSDKVEIGKGNSGKVYRVGDEIEKNSTNDEAKVYAALKGVDGIAQGYEQDGKIRVPFYKHIISTDEIPSDQRSGMSGIISKNVTRINKAVSALIDSGYSYNEPYFQFGMNDDQTVDLIDFSNADNKNPEEALKSNLDTLARTYRVFGVERVSKAVSQVNEVLWNQHHHVKWGGNALLGDEFDGVNYKELSDRLDGKKAENAYYTTNARYVNLKDTAQTDNIDGVKTVLSVRPLTEKEISGWELVPVYTTNPQDEQADKGVKLADKANQSSNGQANESEDGVQKDKPAITTKGVKMADKAVDDIQDFGQKLEGARKFTHTFSQSIKENVDVSSVPLSKSFPQPDYEKLVESGIDPKMLAFVSQLRAAIPTKPKQSYKLARWTSQVNEARIFVADVMDGKYSFDALKDTKLADVLSIADNILPSQIQELGKYKLEKQHFSLFRGEKNVDKWTVTDITGKSGFGGMGNQAHFDSKEQALDYIKKQVSDETEQGVPVAKFDIWTERGKEGVFLGKKVGTRKYIVLKHFDKLADARVYARDHNQELVDLLKKKKSLREERRAENNQRIGKDYRNGKNATAAMFDEAFGFRGVQFGNWVNNDRRQQDLNNAYDGLMDLADVLEIPSRALSLNGELGLAFGARGTGGKIAGGSPAAAHYESDTVVINLTKEHGAGSLAHEWWHALDNYFGNMEGRGEFLTETSPRRGRILEGNKYRDATPEDYKVRQNVFHAWQGITKAINEETQMAKRGAMRDGTRSKDYWSTVREMTARTFERYIIDKLAAKGYENDYLANIIPEEVHDAANKLFGTDEAYAYPLHTEMEAVNKAYDKLFGEVETKETDKGVALYSKSTPVTGSTVADIKKLLPARVNKLVAAGKLKVVQSVEDLPEHIQKGKDEVNKLYDQHKGLTLKSREINKEIGRKLKGVESDSSYSTYSIERLKEIKELTDRQSATISKKIDSLSANLAGQLDGVNALYDGVNDVIYLVADGLSKDEFNSVLSHELLHRAEVQDPKIKATIERFDEHVKRRFELASKGIGNAIEKIAYDRVINAGTQDADRLSEFRAYMVSHWVNNPNSAFGSWKKAVADFVANIRAFLIRNGLDLGFIKSLTPADLAALSKYGADIYRLGKVDNKILSQLASVYKWQGTAHEYDQQFYEGVFSEDGKKPGARFENKYAAQEKNADPAKAKPSENSGVRYSKSMDSAIVAEAKRKAGLGPKKTLSQAITDILQRGISANLKALQQRWEELKPQLEQGIFDKFYGIKLAEKEILGDVAHSLSGYISARLSTGSSSTMQALLLHGAPKWADGIIQKKDGSKGFAEILQPVKDDLENFTAWMVGRRADRLYREGKENNFSRDEIDALLNLKQDGYQGVADGIAELNKSVLDLAQESGLVDPESRKLFENADYIPFYRLVEGKKSGPSKKGGLTHQNSGIKMLKGSDNPMSDPLGNMMQNWAHLIDASMKNDALNKTLVNLEGSRFTTPIPRVEFKQALIPKEQVKKLMLESGLPKDIVDAMPADLTTGIAKMWQMQAPADPDVVRVMRDGKSEYYKVNDALLLTSLTAVNQMPFGGIFKPMRYMKQLLTGAVTADPTFMARNFIRDSMHSWTIAEEKGFKLGLDSIHGAVKSFKEEGGYVDMMFAGASFQGGYGNYNNPDAARESMDAALRRRGIKDVKGFKDSILDTPKKYWEMYRSVGDAIENASREAILENSKQAGAEKAKYLFEAKDLMDFSMQGSFTMIRAMSDMLPFFNARLIGLYRLAKAGKTPEARKMILAKGLSIAMFSLALLALNADNDDYEALEEFDKDQYWHFFFGDQHYRIPKPFELGLIFGTIPERSARALLGKDTLSEYAERMGHGATDTLAFNPIPQLFKPFIELYSNKDMFTGRAIEGMADEGKLPSARYNEYTSETMRALSSALPEALGASPKRLEHLMHGYLGSLGMYALGASDMMVRQLSGMPELPASRMDSLPVLKAFYQEQPTLHTKYGTEFYDMLNEVNQIHKTINAYKKEGNLDKANELRIENADKLRTRKQLESSSKQLSKLRAQVDVVYRSNLSTESKRSKIDALMQRSNEVTRLAVQRSHPYFN